MLFAATLSHYIQDAYQPLHVHNNYDGQLSGQNGVHSRFEAELFERFESRLTINPAPLVAVTDTRQFIFDVALASFQQVPKILEADRGAVAGKDTYDADYFEKFFTTIRPVLEQQMAGAITGTASAIVSAWTEAAGKPELKTCLAAAGSEGQEALVGLAVEAVYLAYRSDWGRLSVDTELAADDTASIGGITARAHRILGAAPSVASWRRWHRVGAAPLHAERGAVESPDGAAGARRRPTGRGMSHRRIDCRAAHALVVMRAASRLPCSCTHRMCPASAAAIREQPLTQRRPSPRPVADRESDGCGGDGDPGPGSVRISSATTSCTAPSATSCRGAAQRQGLERISWTLEVRGRAAAELGEPHSTALETNRRPRRHARGPPAATAGSSHSSIACRGAGALMQETSACYILSANTLKLRDIAERLQCRLEGDGDVDIVRVAAIHKAGRRRSDVRRQRALPAAARHDARVGGHPRPSQGRGGERAAVRCCAPTIRIPRSRTPCRCWCRRRSPRRHRSAERDCERRGHRRRTCRSVRS